MMASASFPCLNKHAHGTRNLPVIPTLLGGDFCIFHKLEKTSPLGAKNCAAALDKRTRLSYNIIVTCLGEILWLMEKF